MLCPSVVGQRTSHSAPTEDEPHSLGYLQLFHRVKMIAAHFSTVESKGLRPLIKKLLLCISNVLIAFVFSKPNKSHVIVCNHFIPFSRGCGVCCWSQSQLSPSKGRVAGSSGAIRGSASCSRTLRHAAQFRGAGIWTSDLPVTGWPALPTELQPPHQQKSPSLIPKCPVGPFQLNILSKALYSILR